MAFKFGQQHKPEHKKKCEHGSLCYCNGLADCEKLIAYWPVYIGLIIGYIIVKIGLVIKHGHN